MPVFVRFAAKSIATALVVASIACARQKVAPRAADTDDFGAAIALDKTPTRIVSLNPTTTEILFAIGAGDRVVGRSRWDTWPIGEVEKVLTLGDGIRPNVEAILGVHPDLVLLYGSDDNRPAAARLRDAGIATVAMRIDSIAQFRRMTRLLGRLVHDTLRANRVVDSVDATLARVEAATASLPRPKVFLHAWEEPLITIGGMSFLNELVSIAGGVNVYADVKAPSTTVSIEDVALRDPDVLIVSPITAAKLRKSERWRVLRAVREGHILVYDTTATGRPSVTLGMAAVNFAGLLHPGSVK